MRLLLLQILYILLPLIHSHLWNKKAVITKSQYHGGLNRLTELYDIECMYLLSNARRKLQRDSENVYILSPSIGSESKEGLERELNLPPLVSSIRCSGELLASATSGKELIEQIISLQLVMRDQWSMKYECLQPIHYTKSKGRSKEEFSSKTIMCSIANIIKQGTFSLHPYDYSDLLGIFETSSGLYLVKIDQDNSVNDNFERCKKSWTQRPFQYSASLSFDISVCALNILRCIISDNMSISTTPPEVKEKKLTLLDPCCGSGTNLMVARRSGFDRVIGFDINPSCINGCMKNLQNEELLNEKNVYLACLDSTRSSNDIHYRSNSSSSNSSSSSSSDSKYAFSGNEKIDAVIANLPWGNNAKDYYGQNLLIIEKTREKIDTNIPCIFISHVNQDLDRVIQQNGCFHIIHSIPLGSNECMYICNSL